MIVSVKDGTLRTIYNDKFPLSLVADLRVERVSTIEPIVTDGRLTFAILWQREYQDKIAMMSVVDEDGLQFTTREQALAFENRCLTRLLTVN